ncbi:poly-gamma-glutamate hydrolase family protein [Rhodoferax lacus]|nr:poly-gamma-glutamate hydrolase family protein [Rhodoferax lacus]
MADRYPSYHALRQNEVEGRDYAIAVQQRQSRVAILAPHGGFIETGTTAIAAAIAADVLSYYSFCGLKPGNNQDLHITSTCFDEPRCHALIATAHSVLTVHGEKSSRDVVFLGGLDEALGTHLERTLGACGFAVEPHHNPRLQGRHAQNICNLGQSGRGVQLELSRGLRSSLFLDHNSAAGLVATPRLQVFAQAVRQGIQECYAGTRTA